MSAVTDAWREYCARLRVFPTALSSLHGPGDSELWRQSEIMLGFPLPAPLQELLSLNNGQVLESTGLFKSVSGWDVYRRHVFLDAASIAKAYKTFVSDAILLQEFGRDEIPFAVCGSPNGYQEAFTLHRQTHQVGLIWTSYQDTFNPPEWLVEKFARAESLDEFIRIQESLYA